jgi:peroxiredoxin
MTREESPMGSSYCGGKPSVFFVALIALAVALSAGLPSSAVAEGFGEEKFKAGDKAPDFTTVDLDGNKVTLSSFNGSKVVLLNFWGLRCGACIEEMPHLNAIYGKYKDKGLVVLGVDTDGVDATIVRDTMKEVGIVADFTILLDMEFTITDTYTNFLVPLTLVIGKSGVIEFIHTGYESGNEKEYEKAVAQALGL